jgi:hypothetical protein
MNTEETASFIAEYGTESRNRICFAWNQKHAADFIDENDAFRQRVITAVVAEPGKAGLELVGDLFEAEAKWSREAWCVRDTFSSLGSILLKRGGTTQLAVFLQWFGVSMDTYCQCHAMDLDPVTLAPLISEVDRSLGETKDNQQKAKLEMARQLFAKIKSGNPMQGMFKLGGDKLGPARVVTKAEIWFDKILRFFKGRNTANGS